MEEEDVIAAGIKQVLKKGGDINKAVNSFLNAGYPRDLVERAARKATGQSVQMPIKQIPMQQRQMQPTMQQRIPVKQQGIRQMPQGAKYPLPSRQLPYQRPELRQPIHKMPEFKEYHFKPLKKEFHAEKPRNMILEWTTAIIIILFTLVLNGFLIWKFMLG